ncbi:hypothetical protein NA56DRAFT_701665 [Hyaloscypha hepaticicola]|uniref:Uncharacterized protein n=1 Tax=Hyaloscypha hepaticicola TaxID=2082293 RepID=A0A2J6QAT5_9HELO|nr:hypothetical protein NA56DRAFT_701665 [Hyaloscypha hepaticicola]
MAIENTSNEKMPRRKMAVAWGETCPMIAIQSLALEKENRDMWRSGGFCWTACIHCLGSWAAHQPATLVLELSTDWGHQGLFPRVSRAKSSPPAKSTTLAEPSVSSLALVLALNRLWLCVWVWRISAAERGKERKGKHCHGHGLRPLSPTIHDIKESFDHLQFDIASSSPSRRILSPFDKRHTLAIAICPGSLLRRRDLGYPLCPELED